MSWSPAPAQAPHSPPDVGERPITVVVKSILGGLAAFAVAIGLERVAFRVSAGRLRAFEWISDALLATAFVGVSFLWLRLRASWDAFSRLERAKVALDTELTLAADIQRRLLPPVPDTEAGCRWAARLRPATQVGGDYFDFLRRADGSLLVLVADVSGHGVAAGLLLSAMRAWFRSEARTSEDPAILLGRLSQAFYEDQQGMTYATAILARVSPDGRCVQVANAGHPPGLLLGASGVRRLDVGGPPAGLFEDTLYESQTLELAEGDIGLLVTDGVSEAAGGGEGLEALLREARAVAGPPSDPARITDALLGSVARAAARFDAPVDDRTVVVFVVGGA
jgi:sigma-B regulation protein RsbU (phosphoserine phosphatase)